MSAVTLRFGVTDILSIFIPMPFKAVIIVRVYPLTPCGIVNIELFVNT